MQYQPASPQDVKIIGWSGPLIFPLLNTYRVHPPDPSSGIRWVFIGENLGPSDYDDLDGFMTGWRSSHAHGLILTVAYGALSPQRLDVISQWSSHQKFHYFEHRTLDPARGFETASRQYVDQRILSFLSVNFDSIADRVDSALQLTNLEVVHVHPPEQLMNEDAIKKNGDILPGVFKFGFTEVRKCVLPFDIIDHLNNTLDRLACGIGLEEFELTSSSTSMEYDQDIAHYLGLESSVPSKDLLFYLGHFTSLKNLIIPISIVTPAFISTISLLSDLKRLKTIPVRTITSPSRFLFAVQAAKVGPGRFRSLVELHLDLDTFDISEGLDWHTKLRRFFPSTRIT